MALKYKLILHDPDAGPDTASAILDGTCASAADLRAIVMNACAMIALSVDLSLDPSEEGDSIDAES